MTLVTDVIRLLSLKRAVKEGRVTLNTYEKVGADVPRLKLSFGGV